MGLDRCWLGSVLICCLIVGCTPPADPPELSPSGQSGRPSPGRPSQAAPTRQPTATASTAGSTSPSPEQSSPEQSSPEQSSSADRPEPDPPARFAVDRVRRDIATLAGKIGPREATSEDYDRAADLVAERFRDLGYRVTSQDVAVPAGDSWGVPVEAGRSRNVIATTPGFDAEADHLVIGAHLDTVAVAPGAEDNASGVAVMLELARLAAAEGTRLPVRFVAFGAEEPRGPDDDQHHFGSTALVGRANDAERSAVRAMVSLDRVGVGSGTVPICASPRGGRGLRADLRRVARSIDIRTESCVTTSSDHWSYAKVGIPGVRIGGVPYPAYHSSADRPSVIDREQLRNVGMITWAWLQS
jgi:hypothetical protein